MPEHAFLALKMSQSASRQPQAVRDGLDAIVHGLDQRIAGVLATRRSGPCEALLFKNSAVEIQADREIVAGMPVAIVGTVGGHGGILAHNGVEIE